MAFYDQFKKIRNRMRTYPRESIFAFCMDSLTQVWNLHLGEVLQQKLPVPMHVLLMLKWGIIYGEHSCIAKKAFGTNEFIAIYNEFSQLSALSGLLKNNDPLAVAKFTRATMSYQLNYQRKSGLHGFALTETLFGKIGLKYDADKTLDDVCGLYVQEFIDYQFVILESMLMERKYRTYNIDFYKYLFIEYGEDRIRKFLNFMSCDSAELRNFLTHDHKNIANPEFEYALLSCLCRKPLFRQGNNFTPYHSALIQSNIEFGVYDILKTADSSSFCSSFGQAFEEYIHLSLDDVGIDHWRETDIRRHTHRDSACDFLVSTTESVVFVEAKSAEMYYLTRHDPKKEYLERTLQNSLISGYQQILTLAQHLRTNHDPLYSGKKAYGIIVTFKDLLLGYPTDIWAEFMEEFMTNCLEQDILNDLPVVAEKLFVLSAYDFDHMLAYSKNHKLSIADCLEIAVANNADQGKRTFFFHDNLVDESIKVLTSPLLKSSMDTVSERIGNALRKGQGI